MKVIMHNTISLNGNFKDFEIDLGIHYGIVQEYNPDVMLVGSRTAKTGIETFMEKVPEETEEDFKPSEQGGLWAIPDSKGIMKGFLHVLRQSEYCRDVVVFVSEKTSQDYLDYLKERNYNYHMIGKENVDLKEALDILNKEYYAEKIIVDGGPTLNSLLLEVGLIDEISLIISPILMGKGSFFNKLRKTIKLELIKNQKFGNNIHLIYKVKK